MESILTPLLQLGAVGVLLSILIIAVRALYERNTKLNDRTHETLTQTLLKNSEAYQQHSVALEKLSTAVDGMSRVIQKCEK